MCSAEALPMRMRALPQSMWQEPNIPHNVSPATVYPVLPPLVTREGDDITGSCTAVIFSLTKNNDSQHYWPFEYEN